MKSFKNFLREDEDAYHDVDIDKIKEITTKSKSKVARFTIDKEDKWHAGDADWFLHDNLTPPNHIKVRGFMHNDKKDEFTYSIGSSAGISTGELEKHHLDLLSKHGITKNKEVMW